MASYVQKSLGAGEIIKIEGRYPPLYWVGAWIVLLVLGVVGIGIVLFVLWAVHMSTTEFAVTNQRVVFKRGLFTRVTEEIAVDAVEAVSVNQSFWGRIFNFGRVTVRGTGEAMIVFPVMDQPVTFRQAIESER